MAAELAPLAGTGDTAVYLDPPTHHQRGDKLFARESNPYAGDDILAPYAAVCDHLTAAGIPVHTADRLPNEPDGKRNLVISFGAPDPLVTDTLRRYRRLHARPDVVLSAFFAMECPVVEPTMFEALPEISRLFRRVLSWSDTDALLPFTRRPVEVQHFCWPQSFSGVHDHLWANRDRKFLVMMNANKLPRIYVNELYTARLRAVQYFHQFGEIDLYGRNWDRMPVRVGKVRTPTTFRRWLAEAWQVKQRLAPNPLYATMASASLGPAVSKSATLAQYRFALCFENSIIKGWMTEKLFDCFFAGTVPVYWGAPEVLDWVPAECFIDMRAFSGFAELRRFLHSLTPAQEERYREAARSYLASPAFAPFKLEAFVSRVVGIVAADAGLSL
jgi:hypothetical protein